MLINFLLILPLCTVIIKLFPKAFSSRNQHGFYMSIKKGSIWNSYIAIYEYVYIFLYIYRLYVYCPYITNISGIHIQAYI